MKIFRIQRSIVIRRDFRIIMAIVTVLATVVPVWALDPAALPTGGRITAGAGGISQTGSAMTITQQTEGFTADWNTFNIGRNASVAFVQPGPASVALNRILDQNPSQIYGSLKSNGRVFLLNPAGVYFGRSAQVDVGGLVASSLSIADEDFLAGRYRFTNEGSAGAIVNEGSIRAAPGGCIAFLSPRIVNEGSLRAPNGAVALVAGEKVSLDFTGDGLVNYTIDRGSIEALVENRGLIEADAGMVVMTAGAADSLTRAVVSNAGVIEAKTLGNRAGRILLLSDRESGETIVGGSLNASAPDGGDGGGIETSGARVTIADDARITTRSAQGRTGQWLIDPYDFTVAPSGGDVTGAALTAALGATDVTIQTLAGSVSCTGVACGGGTAAGNGDIFVNDHVTWAANTLTLNASRNIEINKELFGSGTAKLALLYGQGAGAAGNRATYTVSAPVNLAAGNNFSTKLGSDGTQTDFTVITSLGSADSTTKTDLQGMAGELGGTYALGANIDASSASVWSGGSGFNPVGTVAAQFTGRFDGLGHTVSGLVIDRPATDYVGLFGVASTASDIRNVGMVGGSVRGAGGVGGLAGASDGAITNSYATGMVTGGHSVGGLVGQNGGTITDSYATGTVMGGDDVGGLAGVNSGMIARSYATGAVPGADDYVGGLVGVNSGVITGSYATGAVPGADDYVGGLVGYNADGATITGSHATGAITANGPFVGGLVGWNLDGAAITGSWATGAVTGSGDDVGGLVGWNSGTITDSYAKGSVRGRSRIGGLVGSSGGAGGVITGSHATGTVTGIGNDVGGLAGLNGGVITNCYAAGAVTGSDEVGGLAGYNADRATITGSHATGAVTAYGPFVDGLVGLNDGAIADSWATGTVTGGSIPGGPVGSGPGGGILAVIDATRRNTVAALTSVQNTGDGMIGIGAGRMTLDGAGTRALVNTGTGGEGDPH